MLRSRLIHVAIASALFITGFAAGRVFDPAPVVFAQKAGRVFEIRRYTTLEGRLDALNARFRDHTVRLFQKHGMTNIGYWTPVDEQMSRNTLIYVLAHPDLETAKKNWEAFRSDPEWIKTRTTSEAQGKIVEKVDSMFLTAADYSPLK